MSSIKNRKLLKRFCALQKKGLRNLVATVSISFAMLLPSSNAYACLPCTTAVNLAEPIVWEEVIEEFDEFMRFRNKMWREDWEFKFRDKRV